MDDDELLELIDDLKKSCNCNQKITLIRSLIFNLAEQKKDTDPRNYDKLLFAYEYLRM